MDTQETSGEENSTEGGAVEERVEQKLDKMRQSNATEIVTTEEDVPTAAAASAATSGEKNARGEVSAATVARMMGLATASEISIVEGKVDLLSSRINTMTAKLERVSTLLGQLPTGTDLDRIDINIGSLKTLIRETLERVSTSAQDAAEEQGDAGKLKGAKIMSNTEPAAEEEGGE